MKLRRRTYILVLFVAALIALGVFSGKLFPRDDGPGDEPARVQLDSVETVAWTKANPWLFRDTSLALFRERLVLPFAIANGLGPRGVRRRGASTEMTFPRDRPVHVVALELERAAARAGFVVEEGREVGNAVDRVEYRLRDAAGRAHDLRLVLGQAVSAGSYRMALVITEIGRAGEADRRAWLAFAEAVTLVVPDTLALEAREGGNRDVLVELPMEPAAYPVVKPGPRALFIDDSREEIEGILRERLESNPEAAGFATKHGDRAIESPALMGSVLEFTASRRLLFLDLTGSPRSLAPQLFQTTGAEGFTAVAQDAGMDKWLTAELEHRASAARRSGEGLWVLRHTPGLPAALARVLRAQAEAGGEAPRWVTLRQLRQSGN